MPSRTSVVTRPVDTALALIPDSHENLGDRIALAPIVDALARLYWTGAPVRRLLYDREGLARTKYTYLKARGEPTLTRPTLTRMSAGLRRTSPTYSSNT